MTEQTYQTVLVKKENGIAWVTLNRPGKRNAMSPQLHFDMVEVLTRLDTDPEVKILVLTGAGEAFSAGMDLKLFFRDLDDKPVERALAREADRRWGWYKLNDFSKPTIAMVNGHCYGGAFIPLVACDFAIAADDAKFGLSEINWGILPGGLVSKVVAMTMNYRHSLYYAMTGLHALHVLGGIVAINVIGAMMRAGKNVHRVEYVGIYWHFVDIVWIFLFPLLYLTS